MVHKHYMEIPGCLKCISSMNLPPANIKLFTVSFILYLLNKILPDRGILRKGLFNSELLNNPHASCFS